MPAVILASRPILLAPDNQPYTCLFLLVSSFCFTRFCNNYSQILVTFAAVKTHNATIIFNHQLCYYIM